MIEKLVPARIRIKGKNVEKTKNLTWNDIKIGEYVRVVDRKTNIAFKNGDIVMKTSVFHIGNGHNQCGIIIKSENGIVSAGAQKYLSDMEYSRIQKSELYDAGIF